MADLELHKRFLGEGYVGRVDLPPALSWADRRALEGAAAGSMQSAIELRHLNETMGGMQSALTGVAQSANGVASAIVHLEDQLGFQLSAQTTVLHEQAALLSQVHAALVSPAKTRAAERVMNASELLRRGRWERALSVAEEAIDDDPNNPGAFRAAAWAAMGLKQLDVARKHFLECAEASDGDGRAQAVRQAARLAFVLDGPEAGIATLNFAVDDRVSPVERLAVAYDRGLYLAEIGERTAAQDHLAQAFDGDDRFCVMALHDEIVSRHDQLRTFAEEWLRQLVARLRDERGIAVAALDDASARLGASEDMAFARGYEDDHADLVARRVDVEEELGALQQRDGMSLQSLLQAVEAVRARAEGLAADTVALDQEIERHDRVAAAAAATAQRRRQVLDEAAAKLRVQERAELLSVDGFTATLSRRKLGRETLWSVHVDEEERVTVRRH